MEATENGNEIGGEVLCIVIWPRGLRENTGAKNGGGIMSHLHGGMGVVFVVCVVRV